jgi:hypothetical protein
MVQKEQMKLEALKYLLSFETWNQTVFLVKKKGAVKLTYQRALEWVEAGIDDLECRSKEEMIDLLNTWMENTNG